jgi:hypothetical protein
MGIYSGCILAGDLLWGSIPDLFWGRFKRSFTLQTTTPSFMSFKRRSNDPNERLDQPSHANTCWPTLNLHGCENNT